MIPLTDSNIQTAFIRLKEKIESEDIRQAADLYAEVYEENSDLRELQRRLRERNISCTNDFFV